ncbi:MAG: DUF2007 domain-containing protein [Acidimicrobiia bacterium]
MELIELYRTSNTFEAEVIVARLRDAGVEAVVFGGDAGGWAPHLTIFHGSRVMVPEDALEFAQELLATAE